MRQARPAGRGDGQSSSLTGAYSPSPACLHLTGLAFRKQKNIRIPGAGRLGTKGKRTKLMEDVATIILVVVLCILLRPVLRAILRGLGSSEHRRDR